MPTILILGGSEHLRTALCKALDGNEIMGEKKVTTAATTLRRGGIDMVMISCEPRDGNALNLAMAMRKQKNIDGKPIRGYGDTPILILHPTGAYSDITDKLGVLSVDPKVHLVETTRKYDAPFDSARLSGIVGFYLKNTREF